MNYMETYIFNIFLHSLDTRDIKIIPNPLHSLEELTFTVVVHITYYSTSPFHLQKHCANKFGLLFINKT